MNEVTCPHCTKSVRLKDTELIKLLNAIQSNEFLKQLNDRSELVKQDNYIPSEGINKLTKIVGRAKNIPQNELAFYLEIFAGLIKDDNGWSELKELLHEGLSDEGISSNDIEEFKLIKYHPELFTL